MPTAVGPNTKGEENLVFGYDLGDVQNSYKGPSTTNLVPDATDMSGWSSYSAGNDGTFTTEFGTTGYKVINRNTWNGLHKSITLPSPGTYTISAWFRIWGKSANNNGINVYTNGGGISDTAQGGDDTRIGEWQRISMTRTYTTTSITFFIISWGGTGGVDWSSWDVTMPQVEAGSQVTPFTDGTRSATQGLLDLKGDSTIDLTNVSFDSNAQMTFDGTGDYATIPHNTVMRDTDSLTVETVFQVYSQFGYYGGIIGKGTSDANEEYFLGIHPSGNKIYFDVGQGSGPYINATQTINSNQYYHVVAMHERAGGTSTCSIYVNGEFVSNTTSGATNSVNTNTTDITIGSRWSDGSYSLNGDIPFIKMYNRALTTSEIKANYNAIKGRFNI